MASSGSPSSSDVCPPTYGAYIEQRPLIGRGKPTNLYTAVVRLIVWVVIASSVASGDWVLL